MLAQLKEWLTAGSVKKLVLVITSVATGESLERWEFNLEAEQPLAGEEAKSDKSVKEIHAEIAAIMRQITASVTFLPLNDEQCAFDLLVYTTDDVAVPTTWEESGERLVINAEEVKLRSFTTKVHKVDAAVTYRADA